MSKESIYIETSIISYLAARLSPNLLIAASQQVTAEWWDKSRSNFALFVSELVITEARGGDPQEAARRLEQLRGIPELRISADARDLASTLIVEGAIPPKAGADALHVAIAAVHGIDFLLTWNCRHINNPVTKPRIRAVCAASGHTCPEICTPIEMVEVNQHEQRDS